MTQTKTIYREGYECGNIQGLELIDQLSEQRKNRKNKFQSLDQNDLMTQALHDTEVMNEPQEGDIVLGRIVSVNANAIMVDIGYKTSVYVENKPAETLISDFVGTGPVDVMITQISENPYSITGSMYAVYAKAAHTSMNDKIYRSEPIEAYVKELTPAGYLLDFFIDDIKMQGFMPNVLAGANKLADPTSIVGQTLYVISESFSQEKGTYILSRKKYLQTLMAKEIKQLKINEKVYSGKVTGTTDYGVFIEFNGCLTGMIHKANINPIYHDKLHLIEAGTEIDFYIKEILKDKIILTQIIRETLWDSIENGQTLPGTVIDTKSFGLLVSLDDETKGLVSNEDLEKSGKTFTRGDKVTVKITDINRGKRKISLSFAK